MISVIVPVYNEEKAIWECLASLAKQTGVDYEVIVVDDGSSDNSKIKISHFAKATRDKQNLRLYSQDHLGPGEARNLGAGYAKGEILVFVDSDMTFDTHFLRDLVLPIINGQTKGTFTKNEFVQNWENPWARCWNYNQGIKDNRRHKENYPDKQYVFRAILKKEFDKANGFDPIGYTDDWTLARKLGYQADVVDGATCYHNNPDNLEEIYYQAKWIAKNEFKSAKLKKYFNLMITFPPVSLVIAVIQAIYFQEPLYVFFKMTYDQGIFFGILDRMFKKGLYK